MGRRVLRVMCFLLVALVFVYGPGEMVNAASLTVNSLADESDGSCSDGDCSLRDALALANPNDTIHFSVTGTITLALGSFIIDKSLTINGPGSPSLAINGNSITRLFQVSSGIQATIAGIDMTSGLADGGVEGDGGAIYNSGELSLTDCHLFSNHTSGNGGAIYNEGQLTVNGCNFTGNVADNDGGGIYNDFDGTASIANTHFFSNAAGNDGGGVYNSATSLVTMADSTFVGNNAGNNGGGVYNSIGTTVTLTDNDFSTNLAGNNGGGIANDGSMALIRCSLSSNYADNDGGGIANSNYLKLTRSILSWNGAGNSGGGLANSGTTDMTGSTFSDNSTDGDGGGIANNGVSLDMSTSTFTGNRAGGSGGGIANIWSVLDVADSTFSGNSAVDGGGVYNTYDATSTFTNTIVADSSLGGNCSGAFVAGSTKNLDTDSTCSPGFTQVTSTQLALGTLTGSPAYFPLNLGSAAIDRGTNNGCHTIDQRGAPRPQDGDGDGTAICDVGSYEYWPAQPKLYLPLITKH